MLENNSNNNLTPRPSRNGVKIGLALVAAAALGFNFYLLSKINHVHGTSDLQSTELQSRIQTLEEQLAVQDSRGKHSVDALRADIEQARKQAYSSARNEARRQSDRLAKQVAEKQREQQEMFLGQIGSVKGSTETNQAEIGEVRGNVDGVKTQVAETREELAETADRLIAAQRAMDEVDGRVGANSARLQDIIRRGERELTQFTLVKSKKRSRVEDVQLRLKDTDAGKNRFTIEILADDQLITQKDRYLSEPVEFYVTGAARPYEIVVTAVKKDRIVGYLVRPKFIELARR